MKWFEMVNLIFKFVKIKPDLLFIYFKIYLKHNNNNNK